MFFYIGDKKPFNSLNQVHVRLYLDQGWSTIKVANKQVWYKGYSTECRLSDKISEIIDGYKPAGKWCVIDSDYQVYHPILRGFPIYVMEDQISNLHLPNFEIQIYEHDYTDLDGTINFTEAVNQITSILIENTENFLRFNDISNLHIVYTAGLDSLTSWAVLDTVTKNYKIRYKSKTGIKEYHTDLFPFLDTLWGYNLSNFYSEFNYNVTGFYGERITFREVDCAHVVCNFLGKKVVDTLDQSDYLYHFMNRPSSLKNDYPYFTNENDVKKWCYDRIFYDYQGWHLDNNFMFCPLNDIRIAKTVFKLPLANIIANQKNGTIQREIIKKLNPIMLTLLSDYKNYGNVWENFDRNHLKFFLGKNYDKKI